MDLTDARDIAAIGLDRDRPPRIAGRLVGGSLRRGKVDVGDRHSGSDFGYRERGGTADPRPLITNTTLPCKINICPSRVARRRHHPF
jgi:hypothetical protein